MDWGDSESPARLCEVSSGVLGSAVGVEDHALDVAASGGDGHVRRGGDELRGGG